jgi:hypothetical protein
MDELSVGVFRIEGKVLKFTNGLSVCREHIGKQANKKEEENQ